MNILGLSSRYNDIVSDGNERLDSDPLRIGTKTDNDVSFIVNNQEQLTLTSSGASIQIDEIQGGTDGKIEICDAELEGCGTVEGEWVQIPNPSVSTSVLPDGKPRVNFSAPITDFVMLDNPFTSQDEINISFRVEKSVSAQFTEVAIGYYGNVPPLVFNNPSLAFSEYFGVRAQTPFTDQSNTGTGSSSLSPTKLQPSIGGWNWVDAGIYRVRFTLLDGNATWYVTPPNKREYRVSTCNIALPSLTGNWIPYVYNSTTGSVTSNSHISKNTQDIVIDGWDVNEQFNILNELANNEAVEQLPRVLKVIDQDTNDWKLERKEFEYTLPDRSGRLITVDDIAVNDIDTELVKLEVQENTVRITQAETDIKANSGDIVANANDITALQNTDTALQNQITSNDTDINDIITNPLNGTGFTTRQALWDTVGKTSNMVINVDGTVTKTRDNQLGSIYGTDLLDVSKYNYTIRLTLANSINNTYRWYTLGIYSDKKDFTGLTTAPIPGEDYDSFQHGVMWRWGFNGFGGLMATYSSQSPNENIAAVNVQRLRNTGHYLEFKIINGEIRTIRAVGLGQDLRDSLELVEGDNRSRLVDSKYYIGFHDTSTITNNDVIVDVTIEQIERTLEDLGEDRLTTDYKRLSQNLDATIQDQVESNTTDITELQGETTNLQNQITSNDTDILDIQTEISTIEIGTQEPVDLTRLNDAVLIEEPSSTYQKVEWYSDYMTANISFDSEGVVTKSTSTTRDSITSITSIDFLRYDYDIIVNIFQVSGSLVHFGIIENELMIDDYKGTWFSVNTKQGGTEWGDGFSARVCNPDSALNFRDLALGFSRQDPTYLSTESFDDLKAGHSILFSFRNGVLTEINRRNSATTAWFKYNFAQFDDGGLTNSKLRFSPLKKYKMYLSDGSTNSSSFQASVEYLEKTRNPIGIASEIETLQPIRPDIRRSQFYDSDRGSFQYILSEKNRMITIDTSPYPIYFDGPDKSNLELVVELDPNSVESDYDVIVKHFGSNNTLTVVSGDITFDPDEVKINPWCTTVFRIMKNGEEGKTNSASARKIYSDYNENVVHWSLPNNISNGRANFWAIPFNQDSSTTAHGTWSGRFFIPRRAVLRSLMVFGDTEAYNTFLIGSFRVQVYREDADPYVISIAQTGTLVHDRLIEGRNAGWLPTDVNTRMLEVNAGLDPDNVIRNSNIFGISNMGTSANIIPANSTISLQCTDFGDFDGVACEFKIYMYYQYL